MSPAWRRASLVILSGLYLSAASAQAHPGFRADVAKAPDQWGLVNVVITNRSSIPISALHLFRICKGISGVPDESAVSGFDALMMPIEAPHTVQLHFQGLAPGMKQEFQFPTGEPTCPTGISVLFADGHGEGSDDSTFGWHAMIRDRLAAYAESLRIVEVMRDHTNAETGTFPQQLLAVLDGRRIQITNPHTRDVPDDEVQARNDVLAPFLTPLRVPSMTPDWLMSRDTALAEMQHRIDPLAKWVAKLPAASRP